jgi:hypothetical protein
MIRKSGSRFSEKIMLKQRDESMIRECGSRFSLGANEKALPGDHAQAKRADHGAN